MLHKEVIMKYKLLSVAIIAFMIQLSSGAAVTADKVLTQEYLMNNGYSKQIFDAVNASRARALGEEYYSSEERELRSLTPGKKFLRKLHAYIDPAMDDYSFYHHDVSREPSIYDY